MFNIVRVEVPGPPAWRKGSGDWILVHAQPGSSSNSEDPVRGPVLCAGRTYLGKRGEAWYGTMYMLHGYYASTTIRYRLTLVFERRLR